MLHWTYSTKWQRYSTLIKDRTIKPFLPDTNIFTRVNLLRYLNTYSSVYLKPIIGTGGSGIIRIVLKDGKYRFHYLQNEVIFSDFNKLLFEVNKIIKNRVYMIQQGIDLISINGRPIDFRVLLLKPYEEWKPMGIIGKIGAKNKIVTNKCRGGKAILFKDALIKTFHLADIEIKNLEEMLFVLGIKVGNVLNKEFRGVREIGMDIAIDHKLNLYILETNAMPSYKLFKDHQNKKLYLEIDKDIRYIRRNYRNKYL